MINKKQIEAAISLNNTVLKGCYETIGKLTIERDCSEEEANKKIQEQKALVQYFKGYGEALKYVYLYMEDAPVTSS